MHQIKASNIQYIIILNLCWSLIALAYDWHKLALIPPLAWIFIAICPLYPALLALAWYCIKQQKSRIWIVGFSANATAVFGLISLLYYPLYMYYSNANYVSFLSIPWIWFYAIQGFYIIRHYSLLKTAIAFSGLFLLVSFTVHWLNYSFGFLDTKIFPSQIYNALFLTIGLIIIILTTISLLKQKSDDVLFGTGE